MKTWLKTLDARYLPKDPFFRLLAVNGLAGICIAFILLGGIFTANIGNLRVLVSGDESPLVPVLMLAAGLVITLGSVVIGSAIMLLDNGGRGGRPGRGTPAGPARQFRQGAAIPAVVPVSRR